MMMRPGCSPPEHQGQGTSSTGDSGRKSESEDKPTTSQPPMGASTAAAPSTGARPTFVAVPHTPAAGSTPDLRNIETFLKMGHMDTWEPANVAEFVRNVEDCAVYADVFRDNRIDGYALSNFTFNQCIEPPFSMKMMSAVKLLRSIDILKQRG